MPSSVSSASSSNFPTTTLAPVSAKKELAAAIEKEVNRIESQSFGRRVKSFFENQLNWLTQT